jgi:hypothetical protein
MAVSCTGTPPSPEATPLFARHAGDVALGLRQLTDPQTRTLRDAIVVAGWPCSAIQRTYLQLTEGALFDETWSVGCLEGSYSVELFGDGGQPDVALCTSSAFTVRPCFETFRFRLPHTSQNGRPGTGLDPRLKDLLETTSD